jgi:SAM-dependent methyltransferase
MKRSREEHAARFDEKAADYDADASEEYKACVELVVEHARAGLGDDDVVLDLGTGTGAVAIRLGGDAGHVVGRDISEGMLGEAERKAEERGLANVSFGEGSFREPAYDGPVDMVVSNFAMHHLSDEEKCEAVAVVDELDPERTVLGDVMLFGEADPGEPFYDPSVDEPATVGVLAAALTDAGFVLTAVERVHEQVGVLVADRPAAVDGSSAEVE